MKVRMITLQRSHRKRLYGADSQFTKLTLAGNWMTNAGFKPNTRIRVEVEAGIITLRAAI